MEDDEGIYYFDKGISLCSGYAYMLKGGRAE
jgi:hypothetical protein